ncbi:MAG: dienelactone hydrolase family protein, partial [Bacteroidota bacterium]
LPHPELTYLAPGAANHTWYPYSFLAPIPQNEPGISSGIFTIKSLVDKAKEEGIPSEKIFFLGFSQGACLTSEFLARNPDTYGGALIYSGGVIGPEDTPRNYEGSLKGTPIFLGCSDVDAHVPKWRVDESAEIFEKMEAEVTKRIYPGMPHTIIEDEILFGKEMIQQRMG